jgi:hypothetical protein
MTQRGKCRCGTILQFAKTSQGYKTRCPQCQAIVRLREDTLVRNGRPNERSEGSEERPGGTPVGPPPLPMVPDMSFNAELVPGLTLGDEPPASPADFSILSEPESTAPVAQAEMEVDTDPEPEQSSLLWWLFCLAALAVILLVAVAALRWGG